MRPLRSTALVCLLALGAPAACVAPDETDDDAGDAADGDDGGDDPSDGSDGNDGDGGQESEFRLVELVDTDDGVQRMGVDTVNGIRCTDAAHCAFATSNRQDGGALFVTADGRTLTPVLAAGTDVPDGTSFLDIDDTGAGWIARIDRAGPFVIASADPSAASSWRTVEVGINESEDGFTVLNNQELVRAGSGGDWLYIYSGVAWHAPAGPAPTTLWSGLWSPNRVPPFPADYAERKAADPTLCSSDPEVPIEPDVSRLGYASPDLSFVIYPAGTRNQIGTDAPGVCVSRDGGATFHQVAFPAIGADEIGPLAVYCLDADRCWAFGGVDFDSEPAYVYASTDASAAAPTWRRAQVPSQEDSDEPRAIAFAPDGQRGWLVGDDGLVWTSADGGATWTDVRGRFAAVAGSGIDWTSVFALDAERLWLGGSDGVLVTGP